MKNIFRLAITASIAFTVVAAASASGDLWLTSYKLAVSQSKKTGKPIMVNFTGSDWCHWCIQLDNEVFSKPEFKKWAQKNVVLLELDFPQRKTLSAALKKQNDDLARKYASVVPGFPTILFLDPDGSVFGKYGYDSGGPVKWTQMASRLLPVKKTTSKR